jgi:hypothetical protein
MVFSGAKNKFHRAGSAFRARRALGTIMGKRVGVVGRVAWSAPVMSSHLSGVLVPIFTAHSGARSQGDEDKEGGRRSRHLLFSSVEAAKTRKISLAAVRQRVRTTTS